MRDLLERARAHDVQLNLNSIVGVSDRAGESSTGISDASFMESQVNIRPFPSDEPSTTESRSSVVQRMRPFLVETTLKQHVERVERVFPLARLRGGAEVVAKYLGSHPLPHGLESQGGRTKAGSVSVKNPGRSSRRCLGCPSSKLTG